MVAAYAENGRASRAAHPAVRRILFYGLGTMAQGVVKEERGLLRKGRGNMKAAFIGNWGQNRACGRLRAEVQRPSELPRTEGETGPESVMEATPASKTLYISIGLRSSQACRGMRGRLVGPSCASASRGTWFVLRAADFEIGRTWVEVPTTTPEDVWMWTSPNGGATDWRRRRAVWRLLASSFRASLISVRYHMADHPHGLCNCSLTPGMHVDADNGEAR